jgi:hypothetical protein
MKYIEKRLVPPAILNHILEFYSGTKFELVSTETVSLRNCFWEGGSRSTWYGIDLNSNKIHKLDFNHVHPWSVPNSKNVNLDLNCCVLEHKIVSGKDYGVTIYLHPENCCLNIEDKTELNENEKKFLYYTRSLVSSYAGVKNYRQKNSGLTPEEWQIAKESLIVKKLVNKNGALTVAGKNAALNLKY